MDKQIGSLKMALLSSPHKPNSQIIKALDGRTFPFGDNNVLGMWTPYLAAKEFTSCLGLLKNRFPYEFTMSTAEMFEKLMNDHHGFQVMIQNREKDHKTKLKSTAEKIVRNLFDIPSDIILNASIEDKHMIDIDQDHTEGVKYPSKDRISYINELVQKRIILNALVHGASIHTFKSIHYIVKERIDKISPQLMDLYDAYTAIINFNIWLLNPKSFERFIEDRTHLQGMCKLDLESKTIQAQGINFPSMLTETVKGAIDFLISKGLPSDVSADELKYIYSKADAHKDEMWYYYLGPSLWSDLIEILDVDTQKLPDIISKLSLLSYSDLTTIFSSIFTAPEKAKLKLSLL